MRWLSSTVSTAVAVSLLVGPAAHAEAPAPPLSATTTPIKHFVSLMQQDHSFDNYFGTYPGADGLPDDVCLTDGTSDPSPACAEPERAADRVLEAPLQAEGAFAEQYNGGRMDGFLTAARRQGLRDPRRALGYYDDRDIPYYWNVADQYVLFDRYFSSAPQAGLANQLFWVSGTSGGVEGGNQIPKGGFDLPTVFDRLRAAGTSWKLYVQDYDPDVDLRNRGGGDKAAQVAWAPLLMFPRFLDDPELARNIVPVEQYFEDLRNGELPAVSYIVPAGASEHPRGRISNGQRFVRSLVTALMRSSAWDSSAFLWTYDDWGGWYDHVPPPPVEGGYGLRVPALLVSPYAKRGHVDSTVLDHTSQIAFIQNNWGLTALSPRSAAASDLSSAFDFSAPPRRAVLLSTDRIPGVPSQASRARVVYTAYGSSVAVFSLLLLISMLSAGGLRVRRPREVVVE